MDQGVWLRPFGRTIYTMPPCLLSKEWAGGKQDLPKRTGWDEDLFSVGARELQTDRMKRGLDLVNVKNPMRHLLQAILLLVGCRSWTEWAFMKSPSQFR